MLAMLQYADSAFPAGAVAFSWGLEALAADGELAGPSAVEAFCAGQLRWRWAAVDRPVLAAAHAAHGDLVAVARADRAVDVLATPLELRTGSRRAGAALLGVQAKLGSARAAAYRDRCRAGEAPGHLAAAQGLVFADAGLSLAEAEAASAYALLAGLFGAAVRLSRIGVIDAQRSLTRLRPLAEALLSAPAPGLHEIGGFAWMADVAAMRHERQATRLFAN